MKCLGMDLGTKRLGLATSDRLGLISSPYKVITFDDLTSLVDEVAKIISEEHIEVLVLGYPKNMNNSLGDAVKRTLEFKEKLEEKTHMKVELMDERLSTVEAENVLLEFDMSRKNRKTVIDSVAASIILDTYLRRQNNKEEDK